jgi:DNA-binding protein YbaB
MRDRPISHLRAEFEFLAAQYDRTRKDLETLRERLPTLAGTAESPDGMVTVTVGPRGNLTKIEISPRAYRRLSPTELGELIVEIAEQATRKTYKEMEQLMRPFLSADAPFEKLMTGQADWVEHVRVHLPDSPSQAGVAHHE